MAQTASQAAVYAKGLNNPLTLLTLLVDYCNTVSSVLLLHILSVNTTYVSTPKNSNPVFYVFCLNVFLCEV
jgi:hypothetical protein